MKDSLMEPIGRSVESLYEADDGFKDDGSMIRLKP